MITFEKNLDKDIFELHFDEDGINYLINLLNNLKKNQKYMHVHLQSNKYGGSELSDITQGFNSELINQLDLFYWK